MCAVRIVAIGGRRAVCRAPTLLPTRHCPSGRWCTECCACTCTCTCTHLLEVTPRPRDSGNVHQPVHEHATLALAAHAEQLPRRLQDLSGARLRLGPVRRHVRHAAVGVVLGELGEHGRGLGRASGEQHGGCALRRQRARDALPQAAGAARDDEVLGVGAERDGGEGRRVGRNELRGAEVEAAAAGGRAGGGGPPVTTSLEAARRRRRRRSCMELARRPRCAVAVVAVYCTGAGAEGRPAYRGRGPRADRAERDGCEQ